MYLGPCADLSDLDFFFAPFGNTPLSGLDFFLFTVLALHQLVCHFDDIVQLTSSAR